MSAVNRKRGSPRGQCSTMQGGPLLAASLVTAACMATWTWLSGGRGGWGREGESEEEGSHLILVTFLTPYPLSGLLHASPATLAPPPLPPPPRSERHGVCRARPREWETRRVDCGGWPLRKRIWSVNLGPAVTVTEERGTKGLIPARQGSAMLDTEHQHAGNHFTFATNILPFAV